MWICPKGEGLFFNATNSTFSGNRATNGDGGGLWIRRVNGSIFSKLENLTITGNFANNGGGLYSQNTFGLGGVETTLTSSIVSGNRDGNDNPNNIAGYIENDSSYNLIGTGVIAGTNNILNDNPGLGVLQDNDGPTETHRPNVGSPAIDAGDPTAVAGVADTPEYDQRGANFTRVVDAPGVNDNDGLRIDIGAVELQPAPSASSAPYVLNVLFSNQ